VTDTSQNQLRNLRWRASGALFAGVLVSIIIVAIAERQLSGAVSATYGLHTIFAAGCLVTGVVFWRLSRPLAGSRTRLAGMALLMGMLPAVPWHQSIEVLALAMGFNKPDLSWLPRFASLFLTNAVETLSSLFIFAACYGLAWLIFGAADRRDAERNAATRS
jgi:hypothetical protein